MTVFQFPPAKTVPPAVDVFPLAFPSALEVRTFWGRVASRAKLNREYYPSEEAWLRAVMEMNEEGQKI